MRWFHSRGYDYGDGMPGLPREIHGFVLTKPSEIREHLLDTGIVGAPEFAAPEPVSRADLSRVHDESVLRGLRDPAAVAQAIELPELADLPAEIVDRVVVAPQILATGGTYLVLAAAMRGNWAMNLSGGYHHARRDLSHGFCLVNDLAVAIAKLRQEGLRRRVVVIDLDLHQGDGNAALFSGDRDIYTVSVHEEDCFPFPKMQSDLDIGLPAHTGDKAYLAAVDDAIGHVERHFDPQVIVYLAGSDPYAGDPLGTLALTRGGLLTRDRRVARFAAARRCPLVVLPAGGYSDESPAITARGYAEIAAMSASAPGRQ